VSRELSRRRRRERLAGIALATLGAAVLVIAVIALRNPEGHGPAGAVRTTTSTAAPPAAPKSVPKSTASSAPGTPAAATVSPTSAAPPAAAARLPLVVLNNTPVRGLAARAQARFQAGGWTVTSLGNLSDNTGNIVSTSAYFDPAVPGAETAARALQAQFPAIRRLAPKFAQLPAGPIVVVLTSDYS
jgi:LytR cell envelope-related transcriptional attenuator